MDTTSGVSTPPYNTFGIHTAQGGCKYSYTHSWLCGTKIILNVTKPSQLLNSPRYYPDVYDLHRARRRAEHMKHLPHSACALHAATSLLIGPMTDLFFLAGGCVVGILQCNDKVLPPSGLMWENRIESVFFKALVSLFFVALKLNQNIMQHFNSTFCHIFTILPYVMPFLYHIIQNILHNYT